VSLDGFNKVIALLLIALLLFGGAANAQGNDPVLAQGAESSPALFYQLPLPFSIPSLPVPAFPGPGKDIQDGVLTFYLDNDLSKPRSCRNSGCSEEFGTLV